MYTISRLLVKLNIFLSKKGVRSKKDGHVYYLVLVNTMQATNRVRRLRQAYSQGPGLPMTLGTFSLASDDAAIRPSRHSARVNSSRFILTVGCREKKRSQLFGMYLVRMLTVVRSHYIAGKTAYKRCLLQSSLFCRLGRCLSSSDWKQRTTQPLNTHPGSFIAKGDVHFGRISINSEVHAHSIGARWYKSANDDSYI